MRAWGMSIFKGTVLLSILLLVESKAADFPRSDYWNNIAALSHLNRNADIHSQYIRLDKQLESAWDFSMKIVDALKEETNLTRCVTDTENWIRSLINGELWALTVADSFGKPSSGIFRGNFLWLGDYDQCLSNEYRPDDVHMQYCQTYIVSNGTNNSTLSILLSQAALRIGICLPESCSDLGASVITNAALQLTKFLPGKPPLIGGAFCQPKKTELDGRAIGAIIVFSIFVALLIAGSITDLYLNHQAPYNTREKRTLEKGLSAKEYTPLLDSQSNPQESQSPGLAVRSILCFSVITNTRKLLSVGQSPEGTLDCIHGIRFISMTWVVLGHVYSTSLAVAGNSAVVIEMEKKWSFQPICNAFFSVDTFFVLSGLLVTYHAMREFEKNGRISWLKFYIHRFWRLTPAYMLVLMIEVCLLRFMGDGPTFPKTTGFEVEFCKDTWWTNLLYINNFVHTEKMCFGWSWYLANDMQLYWLSPLVLIPLFYWKSVAYLVIALEILTHIISNSLITYYYDLGMGSITDPSIGDFMQYTYMKPYTRAGPYVIGMIFGYVLHKCKARLKLNQVVNIACWMAAAGMALASLYGLLETHGSDPYPMGWRITYNAFSRISWALAVSWVVLACSTGNGGFVNKLLSWKVLVPLSRLTYCAYLVHLIIVMYCFYTQRATIYIYDVTMAYIFSGLLAISYGAAYITSMLFEAPMIGLEKVLLSH